MKNRSDLYLYIFLAAFGIFVFVLSLNFEAFYEKLLPLIFSGVIILLSIAGIVRALKTRRNVPAKLAESSDVSTAGGEGAEGGESGLKDWNGYWPLAVWLTAYFFGIWVIGFFTASLLLVFLYTKFYGFSWKRSVISAVVGWGAIWLLFSVAFGISMYPGILFEQL
jgi:hypothetical protein